MTYNVSWHQVFRLPEGIVHLYNYDASLVNLWWIRRESVVNLSWACPRCQQLFPVWRIKSVKNMELGLKWVHIARYELILKLERALWLPIISGPLLTPKGAIKNPKIVLKSVPNQPSPLPSGGKSLCSHGSTKALRGRCSPPGHHQRKQHL